MPGRLTTIFDRNKTNVEDRYTRIAQCSYSNDLLAEAEKFSIFAHGSHVGDDEGLARVMECPNGIEANGKFHALAFQEALKRGLSTQRVKLTTDERIHSFGKWKADFYNKKNPTRPARKYLGYIVGVAGEIRKVKNAHGNRLFGVFATPENDPAHADIFLVTALNEGDKLHVQRIFHRVFNMENIVSAPV